MEEHRDEPVSKKIYDTLFQTRWQTFRDVITYVRQNNWQTDGLAFIRARKAHGRPGTSVTVENVYNTGRDRQLRLSKNLQMSETAMHLAVVKTIMNKYPSYPSIQVTENDWGRHNVFVNSAAYYPEAASAGDLKINLQDIVGKKKECLRKS